MVKWKIGKKAIFVIFDFTVFQTERKIKHFLIDSYILVDNKWVSTKYSNEMRIWSISEAPRSWQEWQNEELDKKAIFAIFDFTVSQTKQKMKQFFDRFLLTS